MRTPDYGDPRLPARFWAKVQPEPNTGCWLWSAATMSTGYGAFGVTSKNIQLSHRVTYLTLVGPIPEGREIDHLCRQRACCNPAHLEAVTAQTNITRQPRVINARAASHCKSGHEFTPENTQWFSGGRNKPIRRRCRTCRLAMKRRDRERQKAEKLGRRIVAKRADFEAWLDRQEQATGRGGEQDVAS